MDTMLFEYTVQHAPEWVPVIGVLVLLWRISRVLCAALPDIIERVTDIKHLHERTLNEIRQLKDDHLDLHDRVAVIEEHCEHCSANRRRPTHIGFNDGR